MRTIIWISFLLSVSISCLEEPDCVNIRNNVIGVTFKNLTDGKASKQLIDSIKAEGTSIHLIKPDTTASKILLPLDYTQDTTFFTLQIQDTTYHLVLTYTSQPEFISQACGERFVLGSLKVAEHSFDSVRIVSPKPGVNKNANNIEIFKKHGV
jgi:hypothetical protein